MNKSRFVLPAIIGCLALLFAGGIQAAHAATAPAAGESATSVPSGHLVWQIGEPDGFSNEFGVFHKGPEVVTIAQSGGKMDAAGVASVSRGIRGSNNPTVDISYPLSSVPQNGVMFSFRVLTDPKFGAQMAVFSNGGMTGLIQLWGNTGTEVPYPWKKTYRLYIPKEFLKVGPNELRLAAEAPMWSELSGDIANASMWTWDFLKLEALDSPINEPWHGKVTYLGTQFSIGDRTFAVDDTTLQLAPVGLKWLGIAYSGNPVRVCYWYDIDHTNTQTRRLEYLKLLTEYNVTPVVDRTSGNLFRNDPDGHIPKKITDDLQNFFRTYGNYFQFYELGNEPCMFGNESSGGYAEYMTLAKYISENKPAHVKLVAPGWAYGGGKGGQPANWDADGGMRRDVEKYCDLINGHSYGSSYTDQRGGSFVEEQISNGPVEDGWSKPYLNSETGTNNWHSEENGSRQPSSQSKTSAFDRILRVHVAVVDRILQHAAIFGEFGLFQQPAPADIMQLQSQSPPDGEGKDTRVKTFRRLALAYATHGAPLPYTVLNQSALPYKMAYFRAVNTATLPPLGGSGATSNKVLLNFVNFENEPQTLSVRITLPRAGAYKAERIAAGDVFAKAYSTLQVAAKPDVELTEALGPGESVQYILTP